MPKRAGPAFKLLVGTCVVIAACQLSVHATTVTYLTNFTKDNNIYTNLNEQFPNTGAGVPGSGVGTPNSTYLFTPTATGTGNAANVNYANNGIGFLLASDAAGHDFADIGLSDNISASVANATAVYLLLGAYNGQSADITLNGTNGVTQTFSNIYIPDFNGGTIDTAAGGVSDQTVFRVYDQGAGGSGNSSNGAVNYYDLTEVGLTLGSQFTGQTLTSVTVASHGYETLLLGATAVSAFPAAVPEPNSWVMMIMGFGLAGSAIRRINRKANAPVRRAMVLFGGAS